MILTKKNTHCHLCVGFGHSLKECPTYKYVKQAVRRCKVLKGGWKAIYQHLYELGKLDNRYTIEHPATVASYAGSTKGQIWDLMVSSLTENEKTVLRISLGPQPPQWGADMIDLFFDPKIKFAQLIVHILSILSISDSLF